MKILLRALLPICIAVAALNSVKAAEVISKGDIVVVPLKGEISPPLFLFLRRALKTAERAQAGAIIFEMDTFGGRLDSAAEITSVLNHSTIPTYTFINSNAG